MRRQLAHLNGRELPLAFQFTRFAVPTGLIESLPVGIEVIGKAFDEVPSCAWVDTSMSPNGWRGTGRGGDSYLSVPH